MRMELMAPVVSVVVPTYNRPDLLERCLVALTHQSISPDAYEIIVCDDGPSKATEAVVQAAQNRLGGRPLIQYVPVRRTQGPAGARNAGWRQARSLVIAFTDDDTIPEPDWLGAGMLAMSSGVEAVSGRIVMPLPQRPSDYERDASRLQDAEFATANCFVRRDALQSVGGFDERFTSAWREDSDLHFALLERGYSVVAAPDAIVVHPLRAAAFAAGIGLQRKIVFDVLLYRKYPDLYRERIRHGPPWFYLSVSAALVLALMALLAGELQMALAAASVWLVLTLAFFLRRLSQSSFTLRNLGELLITSLVIPPLSIFWRIVGCMRFGRSFP